MSNFSNRPADALEKARAYETTHAEPSMPRPAFHVTPLVGWMNDPNGFSIFNGEYHLFYQYHPYNTKWGPMHWGHVVSKDLVTWKYLPCSLAPDHDYDAEGCFSGSAVEHDGKQFLFYTGVSQIQEDGTTHQTQCLAVGDGIDFIKYENNPIIDAGTLPEGSSKIDFRDPKVVKENDIYYMIVGSRHQDGSGQIAVYSSLDCYSWKFENIVSRCENRYGKMWECPDLFELDGKRVLLTSPQDMIKEGYDFHSGNGTIVIVGNQESITGKLERDTVAAIDYGTDFYATQTLLTEDGRRIMLGWMQNWDCYMTPETSSWSGMMTYPRELHVKGSHLIQSPARELEAYYADTVLLEHTHIQYKQSLTAFSGRLLDFTLDIDASSCEEFCLNMAENERFATTVSYCPQEHLLTFDRSESGMIRDCITSRTLRTADRNGKLSLRVLMDRYSVEIFINDGEQTVTSLIFTDQAADGISVESKGGSAEISGVCHHLKF